jgi:hypothetical protein
VGVLEMLRRKTKVDGTVLKLLVKTLLIKVSLYVAAKLQSQNSEHDYADIR